MMINRSVTIKLFRVVTEKLRKTFCFEGTGLSPFCKFSPTSSPAQGITSRPICTYLRIQVSLKGDAYLRPDQTKLCVCVCVCVLYDCHRTKQTSRQEQTLINTKTEDELLNLAAFGANCNISYHKRTWRYRDRSVKDSRKL